MATLPPHALEVSPDDKLQFTLTRSWDSPVRCTMTLHHPGLTDDHLAFKIKTTQPRRYLVRPNQGLVAPHQTESVNILLVEKDKNVLVQSYDRLGQGALDHSKDKFLVQSCSVSDEFAKQYGAQQSKAKAMKTGSTEAAKLQKELADALTTMWNSMSSSNASVATGGPGGTPIYNKKLHVVHVAEQVAGGKSGGGTGTSKDATSSTPNLAAIESMTPEQMFTELNALRRKYDELVNFSVNLTAERDILNNTLEQTKRDLNREVQARAAADNKSGSPYGGGASGSASRADGTDKSGAMSSNMMMIMMIAFVMSFITFIMGAKMGKEDNLAFVEGLPIVGSLLGDASEVVEGSEL